MITKRVAAVVTALVLGSGLSLAGDFRFSLGYSRGCDYGYVDAGRTVVYDAPCYYDSYTTYAPAYYIPTVRYVEPVCYAPRTVIVRPERYYAPRTVYYHGGHGGRSVRVHVRHH